LEVMEFEARNEHQSPAGSPVEVALGVRKDLKEFQRTSSPQAYREELRVALRERLLQGVDDGSEIVGSKPGLEVGPKPGPDVGPDVGRYADGFPIVGCYSLLDYLKERGLIRSKSPAWLRRRNAASKATHTATGAVTTGAAASQQGAGPEESTPSSQQGSAPAAI
jgi:hypothetical protein